MKLIITALILMLSTEVFSIPAESSVFGDNHKMVNIQRALVMSSCEGGEDIVPAARALIQKYFETDMLNSEFYTTFIWYEPDAERYASCIVCELNRPNDPYWERHFNPRCEIESEHNTFYADETLLELEDWGGLL